MKKYPTLSPQMILSILLCLNKHEFACLASPDQKLFVFDLASEKEVSKLIMQSPNTSCELDPIPTWLGRTHLKSLLKVITVIINKSLDDGMPKSFKNSIIRPTLKKGAADKNSLQSYRPVANLSFVSKVTERVVSKRLKKFCEIHHIFDSSQHAYRRGHSCEAALLTVHEAAVTAIDRGEVMLLVLLDLTAAFDVIDHKLLLVRLEYLGITDRAHKWLQEYLANRSHVVKCHEFSSALEYTNIGVPQCSVLGPLLFAIFMTDLRGVFEKHPRIRDLCRRHAGVRYLSAS